MVWTRAEGVTEGLGLRGGRMNSGGQMNSVHSVGWCDIRHGMDRLMAMASVDASQSKASAGCSVGSARGS